MADMYRDRAFLLVLLSVITMKAWIALQFGALKMGPDTLFIETAVLLLEDGEWLHDAGLDQDAIPHSLWKTVGYSFLIAGFMSVFGDTWHFWLFGFQNVVSLVAGIWLLALARSIGLPRYVSLVAFFLYQASTPLSTDVLVATNSLDGSLITILLCDLCIRLAGKSEISWVRMIGYALMFSACLFMRLTYEYWLPFFILQLGFLLIVSGYSWRRSVMMLLIFLAPVSCTLIAYKGWNAYRIGEWVSTSGGQTAYTLAAIRFAKFAMPDEPDQMIPDLGEPLSNVLKSELAGPAVDDYVLTKSLNRDLFRSHGLNALDIHQQAKNVYQAMILSYPVEWGGMMIKNAALRLKAGLFTGPIPQYDNLLWWQQVMGGPKFHTGWREDFHAFRNTWDFSKLSIGVAVNAGLRVGLIFIGFAAMAMLVFGSVRYLIAFRRPLSPGHAITFSFSLAFFAALSMYSLIYAESRYLSHVIGPSILSAIFFTCHLLSFCRQNLGRLKTA